MRKVAVFFLLAALPAQAAEVCTVPSTGLSSMDRDQAFLAQFGATPQPYIFSLKELQQIVDQNLAQKPELKNSGLTDAEMIAIVGYGKADYSELNSSLNSCDSHVAALALYIEVLDSALSKLPNYVGTVVRGTHLPDAVLAEHVPGAVVTYPAFTSTTAGNAVPKAFVSTDTIVIHSKTGKRIADFAFDHSEDEVLFKNGTSFRVLSVEHRDCQPICNEITLDEI